MRISHLGLGAALLLAGCSSSSDPDALLATITHDSLIKHIEVLSADEFMGRAPATEGEEKAVNYIIEQYRSYGLKPAFGTSFIQDVPVVSFRTNPDVTMNVTGGGADWNLAYRTEFIASPAGTQEKVSIKNAELIYVGYGVQAPEENWDDFKGVDVKGKIIVVKNNDPASHPNKFGGNARLYYGRWSYKYEKAAELGALGVIIVHTTETAGYGWDVVANSWGGQQFRLASVATGEHTELNGWLTYDISKQLFQRAGLDLDAQLAAAENPDFQPVPLNNVRLNVEMGASFDQLNVKNVGGIVEGSDLKDEFVVFSAHHDHLGVGTPVDGDSIYNGARDNASGISAILNIARIYGESAEAPRRSILFLATGAEENGLLGAKHFAANPIVEPGKIAANINIDGLNIFGKTSDIINIGNGRTDIDDLLLPLLEADGRTVIGDRNPEQGIFYRSDHFPFARIGVPPFYPNPGISYIGKPDNFLKDVVEPDGIRNYHTVTDEIEDFWDMSGAAEDVKLFYRLSIAIANADAKRMWRSGDEFEAARLESLKKVEGN